MKGTFSQGVVVLLSTPVTLSELRPLLPEHPFLREIHSNKNWEFGGTNAVIAYRPEVNGHAIIDTVPHRWPDHMGSPKGEPMLFGAWTMGHFGPFAFPQGLERACEQAWSWPQAKTVVPTHCAFVRLRLTYVLGGGPDAKVVPPDYRPQHELEFLTNIARSLLDHPAALCLFNSSGEVVLPVVKVDESLRFHAENRIPALDLWANIRLFNLTPDWLMMDTVGNWQLDMPDHEAAFPKDRFDCGEISRFLRNASLYVQTRGDVINDNDTMDGPGNQRWQAVRFDDSIASPPREVLCWVPLGSGPIPEQVTQRKSESSPRAENETPKPRKWWQRWVVHDERLSQGDRRLAPGHSFASLISSQ